MYKGQVVIKKPYMRQNDDGTSSLVADIDDNRVKKEIAITVSDKYSEYLTTERSDAFVIALLYYCMVNEYDIAWETPCNAQLITQLKEWLIPMYDQYFKYFHYINLLGEVTNKRLKLSNGVVATGMSNGVDGLYTIRKYKDYGDDNFRLTHVILSDWFMWDWGEEKRKALLKKNLNHYTRDARELGLEFIYVSFNLSAFNIGYFLDIKCGILNDTSFHTLKYCLPAFALQKLIGTYYFSSTYSPLQFTLFANDLSHHDIYTLPMISVDEVRFYSTGGETDRVNKVKQLLEWDYAKCHLDVCWRDGEKNCGKCSKCVRTMGDLWVWDGLDGFKERFPLENFYKHKSKYLGEILGKSWAGIPFEREIAETATAIHKSFPIGSFFIAPIFFMYESIKKMAKKNKSIVRIYTNKKIRERSKK